MITKNQVYLEMSQTHLAKLPCALFHLNFSNTGKMLGEKDKTLPLRPSLEKSKSNQFLNLKRSV